MEDYRAIRLDELWEYDSILRYFGYAGFIWTLY